ncbi:hypothetical protein IE53DRAFT_389062 [Violaceomyces palustris]|uniref:Uncharacterized protein n=1 Tax=Violaceomyces palustris TaxID=1673888 RepID=A0ACD0NSK7_9BASI|nr:hypothetical protein IE53DRAFT_389062 [Violaceomyces palustris]
MLRHPLKRHISRHSLTTPSFLTKREANLDFSPSNPSSRPSPTNDDGETRAPLPLILGINKHSSPRYRDSSSFVRSSPSSSPHVFRDRVGPPRGFATYAPSKSSSNPPPTSPFEFIISYGIAGKPRLAQEESEVEGSDSGSSAAASTKTTTTSEAQVNQIGFPPESEIGRWRDQLLRGGEAGEDCLMVTEMGVRGDKAMGVADGVGGWTENGVDPSLFSQALMFHASKRASETHACPERMTEQDERQPDQGKAGGVGEKEKSRPNPPHPGSPKELLSHAYRKVLEEEKEVIAGSATACIITLDSSKGKLRSANLGDSGFVILRRGSGKQGVLYASQPQQMGFNTPLQLAKLPIEMIQEGSISNRPEEADTFECSLRNGDVIILGTDGVFDNVDPRNEIPQFVRFVREKHHASWVARKNESRVGGGEEEGSETNDQLEEDVEFVQVLASNLVEYTKICQNSTQKQSPFEREAARYGIHFPGGKVDDISLCCCLVLER